MMQAFARRSIFKNSGGSGDKPAKPNLHAASQGVAQWGQSGDKLRAEWGHSYIVRIFTHSLLWEFRFAFAWPALPATIADAFAHCWNWARGGFPLEQPARARVVDNFAQTICLNFKQMAVAANPMIQLNILLKRTKLCNFVCSTTGIMLIKSTYIYFLSALRYHLKKRSTLPHEKWNDNMNPIEFNQALESLAWKQADFCRKAGLDKNTPSRWVNGKTPIPAWVGAYLGAMLEIKRLHRVYIESEA